jgi:hypothetical protein
MKGRTEKMAKRKSSPGILAANGIFDKKTEQVHIRVHDLSAWDVPGLYPITREANLTPKKEELVT